MTDECDSDDDGDVDGDYLKDDNHHGSPGAWDALTHSNNNEHQPGVPDHDDYEDDYDEDYGEDYDGCVNKNDRRNSRGTLRQKEKKKKKEESNSNSNSNGRSNSNSNSNSNSKISGSSGSS